MAVDLPGGPAVDLVEITDPADPRLDDFRDLSRADRRPDRPGGKGLVIAEGVVVVRRLLASRYPVRTVLGQRRRIEELLPDLRAAATPWSPVAGTALPVLVASAEVMAAAVGFHLNRGVLATADRADFPAADDLLATARTVAVLEGVNDHENLGALFRSAAALGVDAVLLADGCADPLYRRSVRVSMGTVVFVPFAPLPDWPDRAFARLRAAGFRTVALTPSGERTLRTAGLDDAERVAVLLGAEGPGLTDAALAAADVRVRIPMARGVDSLNVATAAAVAFATLADRPERADVPSGRPTRWMGDHSASHSDQAH